MSTRRFVKLGLEALGERIVPSANPFETPEPPVEVSVSPETGGHTVEPVNTPTPPYSGGIEPINPLPPVGLPQRPVMAPIDPVAEAAILQGLNADLTATQAAIENLDPMAEDYLEELGVLQLREALLTSAIEMTGAIAANVLAFAALAQQADALEASITPLLQNPPTTVEGMNHLLGLISQYTAVCSQMLALVESTADLVAARAEIMSTLGITP
jgi:hypothetical protein